MKPGLTFGYAGILLIGLLGCSAPISKPPAALNLPTQDAEDRVLENSAPENSALEAQGFRATSTQNIEFPSGTPGIYNVRDYGAKGDGVTDDTAALKATFQAIDNIPFQRPNADNSMVYLPNGTYLVSDTISFTQYRVLQGQSEGGVIIKLRDNAPDYGAGSSKPVLRTLYSNNESFANYIRNLTVDIGAGNAGAIGIRYNTHNTGILENVTIRSSDGSGSVGLDLSETEFGPGLVKDLSVEGFDYGIRTPFAPSNATLVNISIRGQKVAGIENFFPVSIQNLYSRNKVVAITNASAYTAHLVLVGANLVGGDASTVAIQNEGSAYLANVSTKGYQAALKNKGSVVAGNTIGEFIEGERIGAGSSGGHLPLGLLNPPTPFFEPAAQWVIPDSSAQDDTAAVQQALDSGASTIFFPYSVDYRITDTLRVPVTVRRMVGMLRGGLSGSYETFKDKPMLRLEGVSSMPISIEGLSTNAYPDKGHLGLEIASSRDVYLKSFNPTPAGIVRTVAGAKGRLFLDEYVSNLRLNSSQRVQVRQLNTENNPYDIVNPPPTPTYVVNQGAKLVVLGWKTEALAVHGVTSGGGQTKVLGGFFRDFFLSSTIPYFETTDASLSATYFTYDFQGCGNTRELHGIETRAGVKTEVRLPACSRAVSLYKSVP